MIKMAQENSLKGETTIDESLVGVGGWWCVPFNCSVFVSVISFAQKLPDGSERVLLRRQVINAFLIVPLEKCRTRRFARSSLSIYTWSFENGISLSSFPGTIKINIYSTVPQACHKQK